MRARSKTVSATYGRKINLGNFNSVTIEATTWADVEFEQGDTGENNSDGTRKVFGTIFGDLKAVVKEQADPIMQYLKNQQKQEMQQVVAGLPAELQRTVTGSIGNTIDVKQTVKSNGSGNGNGHSEGK